MTDIDEGRIALGILIGRVGSMIPSVNQYTKTTKKKAKEKRLTDEDLRERVIEILEYADEVKGRGDESSGKTN